MEAKDWCMWLNIEREKEKEFFRRDEGSGRGHFMNFFRKEFVWILLSTASATDCVNSGTNYQQQLYHPKA